ncbi:YdcF family protein [Trichococcus shcherbakoviae]|uniref:YdcF family protein n=1 Tax=Trichococcus shcherbakoviae subsp. psychrophilus TaxID=2585775 RepID=A0A5C5E6V1_9LACT|nr:YdcF family protein [Trichococcus shcherbakoviae]TNV68372.1 YdcF family protein [Trichococcus shcherbakoviae subsp. psychrophilus]
MANYPFDKERSLLKTDESTRITMLLLNIFLIVTGVSLAISFYILANLEINEEPVVSDIIIVPEGAPERGIKASELLDEGYSDSGKIIVSPLLVDAELMHLQPYGELGMMDDDILADYQATSTWTNALYSIALMEENGYDTAIVVSSDYHMNRVKFSFEKAVEGKSLKFTYVSAGGPYGLPWIETQLGRRLAQYEIFKTVGYWLGLYSFIDIGEGGS